MPKNKMIQPPKERLLSILKQYFTQTVFDTLSVFGVDFTVKEFTKVINNFKMLSDYES